MKNSKKEMSWRPSALLVIFVLLSVLAGALVFAFGFTKTMVEGDLGTYTKYGWYSTVYGIDCMDGNYSYSFVPLVIACVAICMPFLTFVFGKRMNGSAQVYFAVILTAIMFLLFVMASQFNLDLNEGRRYYWCCALYGTAEEVYIWQIV